MGGDDMGRAVGCRGCWWAMRNVAAHLRLLSGRYRRRVGATVRIRYLDGALERASARAADRGGMGISDRPHATAVGWPARHLSRPPAGRSPGAVHPPIPRLVSVADADSGTSSGCAGGVPPSAWRLRIEEGSGHVCERG